jgi:hypothetical protein
VKRHLCPLYAVSIYIGKDGISPNLCKQAWDALEEDTIIPL